MILDDGIVRLYRRGEDEENGIGTVYLRAWYKTRTVGVHRFFEARQAGQRIDKLIRILQPPEAQSVWADDVCTFGESEQLWRVVQMQETTDEESGESVLDISLERMSGIWQ